MTKERHLDTLFCRCALQFLCAHTHPRTTLKLSLDPFVHRAFNVWMKFLYVFICRSTMSLASHYFFYAFIYAHSLVVVVMCMYVFILPYYAGALTIFRNFIFIFIVNAIFRACSVHVIWCDQNFVCFHCKFLLLLLLFLIIVIQFSFPQVHFLRIFFPYHSHPYRQCVFFFFPFWRNVLNH